MLLVHRFVAESTGNQASSRLLSMKSANSLLELPAREGVIAPGTLVSAILISDIIGSHEKFKVPLPTVSNHTQSEIGSQATKVAILTVSDTVNSGAGPDRRY